MKTDHTAAGTLCVTEQYDPFYIQKCKSDNVSGPFSVIKKDVPMGQKPLLPAKYSISGPVDYPNIAV